MRKKVEVFFVDGYKLVIQSTESLYEEDNFVIEIIAEDLETLQKLALEKLVEKKIIENGKIQENLYRVGYLEYKENKYIIIEEKCSERKVRRVINNIVTSEYYKSLLKLRKEEDKKREI
ncbi:MAG: hypothetical protein KAW92_11800 [Candidatus Cloacimonetes bacterium]|nr:hypothetical protein [Candidatus Cloacimonadota bacterium]